MEGADEDKEVYISEWEKDGARQQVFVCVSEGDSWFHRGKENEAAEQPEQRRGLLSDWQVDFSNAAESVVTDKPAW